jgi:spore germination cell wall hydrolase CwlJ-like protein
MRIVRPAVRAFALAALAGLAACGSMRSAKHERECMARAMYFESNRSSDEGMLAVGTVVMNRVESDKFPDTVCGVVGQKKQFAPGVLSKPMKEKKSRERAFRMADKVLGGKRHRGVGRKAMFFHTAGHNFRYDNMHYQVIAGGNAFYEKRTAKPGQRNTTQVEVAQAARRRARPNIEEAPVMVAERPAPAREVQVAAIVPSYPAPAPAPVPAAPELVWTPAPPPPAWTPPAADPLLAAAPLAAPTSIEDLIMMNGGG